MKNGGTIEIVADPAQCGQGYTPVSWNVQGPQGEPGAPGEPGMDGAPGAQGPPGPALYVYDGNGTSVGLYGGDAPGSVQVFDETSGVMLTISVAGTLAGPQTSFYFESADCTGTPYFQGEQGPPVAGVLYSAGQRLFALETPAPVVTVTISSVFDGILCHPQPPEDTPGLLGREVILSLTFPLATPLSIGLPPQ